MNKVKSKLKYFISLTKVNIWTLDSSNGQIYVYGNICNILDEVTPHLHMST